MYYTCSHCTMNFTTEKKCLEHEERHIADVRELELEINRLNKENKQLRNKITELEAE